MSNDPRTHGGTDPDVPTSPDPEVDPEHPTIPDPDDAPLMNEEEGGDSTGHDQSLPLEEDQPRE